MKIKKIYFLAFFLSIFTFTPPIVEAGDNYQHEINQGHLDISEVPLANQVIALEGDWAFYWNELLTPEDFKPHTSRLNNHTYIQAPSTFEEAEYSGNKTLSNTGFGTYHLRMTVNKEDINKLMALYIPSVASSFKLWVNGELLASNGVVGTDRQSMKPKSYSQTASFVPQSTEIEIVMQVSNFSQRKGGMWAPIKFGIAQEINKQRELNFIQELFIASTLLALGFYLLSFYFFRATTKLPLFLGLLCLFISIRTLLVGEMLLIYLFPTFSWAVSVKLEYLTIYVGLMVVTIFLFYLFPNEMNRKVAHVLVVISILFSLTTLFPAYIFTHFMKAFEVFLVITFFFYLYTVTLALTRKREGAYLNFFSICFLMLAAVNDILYYNSLTHRADLTNVAACIFLFAQTIIIAKKNSKVFSQVESLSEEIQKANTKLEQKVKERTLELQEKNDKLQSIEQSRKEFFSSVAHEIGTPLQSIQGYIQLIQSNLQSKELEKYSNIAYEKTKLLNHLTKDLLVLAKMDEGYFEFIFEETEPVPLLDYLFNRFKFDIEKAGINYEYIQPSNLPEEYTLLLDIDIVRFEQVISNIISNAIKFTPQGGSILMKGSFKKETEYQKEVGIFQIEICDNGVGIEPTLVPNIFKRFVKTKDPLIKNSGSGIGLAICKEIIEKHGGTISAKSVLDEGSCFLIKLPVQVIRKA
ncbi:sensor histidine kinase [Alkalihalobacillus sp. 1P02AB]|uniref:sensor histidine kinase n=1 Tax=Alkalihalobacillus sp. 1P02AB TaxID=3132260 RepID=UPI0039A74A27